jgi:hypothetical protein
MHLGHFNNKRKGQRIPSMIVMAEAKEFCSRLVNAQVPLKVVQNVLQQRDTKLPHENTQ